MDGNAVYEFYDPNGEYIEILQVSSPPQNVAVGDQSSGTMYHITWEEPMDDGGFEIWEYAIFWDDYSYGEWFMPIMWIGADADALEFV